MMKTESERLSRLIALARRGRTCPASNLTDPTTAADANAGPDEALTPPPGFAARVAAQWAQSGSTGRPGMSTADLWERLSWWGSGVAVASCLLVLAVHRPAPEPTTFDLLLGAPAIELF